MHWRTGWRRLLEGGERLVGWFVHLKLMVGTRWDIFQGWRGIAGVWRVLRLKFKLIPPHLARLH